MVIQAMCGSSQLFSDFTFRKNPLDTALCKDIGEANPVFDGRETSRKGYAQPYEYSINEIISAMRK